MFMCTENQFNKEQLMSGFPVTHIHESNSLTDLLRYGKEEEYFIKCEMYSELKDRDNIDSVYKIVEFAQGVELTDISGNNLLIKQLIERGIRYLAFFSGGRDFIVNAIACSDHSVLDELIHNKEYKITDVPIQYPVKIQDLQDLLRV